MEVQTAIPPAINHFSPVVREFHESNPGFAVDEGAAFVVVVVTVVTADDNDTGVAFVLALGVEV